jgi:hypothetical protein
MYKHELVVASILQPWFLVEPRRVPGIPWFSALGGVTYILLKIVVFFYFIESSI